MDQAGVEPDQHTFAHIPTYQAQSGRLGNVSVSPRGGHRNITTNSLPRKKRCLFLALFEALGAG